MSFVYRYLDKREVVKYVGIVKGDTIDALIRRFNQHTREPDFKKSWRCEYVEGLTFTDAQLLEKHFIGVYKDTIINKILLDHGPLTVVDIHPLDWKQLSPPWQSRKSFCKSLESLTPPRLQNAQENHCVPGLSQDLAEKARLLGEKEMELEEKDRRISQLIDELSATQEWLISAWAALDERAEMCLDCGQPRKAAAG